MAETLELTERARILMKVLVERYIEEGAPVGSRNLARASGLSVSAATIRNVMADLEEMGLVCSPHTSAGRVPTARGFRFFVDSLLEVQELSEQEVRGLNSRLGHTEEIGQLLERASSTLSEATQMASIVMIPRSEHRSISQVEFLPLSENRVLVILILDDREVQNRIITTSRNYSHSELEQAANYLNSLLAGAELPRVREQILQEMGAIRDQLDAMMQAVLEMTQRAIGEEGEDKDVLVSGESKLMGAGELTDIERLRQLFEAFEEKREMLQLLDQALHGQGIQIFIGKESGYEVFDGCSLITSTYEADGDVMGVVGVIGPTRMPYQRVIPIVDVTARLLAAHLKSRG
ncbi:MAG: heat-inducible transcription repressor HrcA [Gammaproteobacteria bacterium]|nr:MAG: heat-inducible transcription repressor HrcA [Gammaproteobacteria bacterium]